MLMHKKMSDAYILTILAIYMYITAYNKEEKALLFVTQLLKKEFVNRQCVECKHGLLIMNFAQVLKQIKAPRCL